MPLSAVCFDIDGTLVDSNEFHVMAWDEAIKDCGRWSAREAIREQIGKGADMLLPSLFGDLGQSEAIAIAKRHRDIFGTRFLKQVEPFKHAADLISLLHDKGKRVVLASSADSSEVDYYVQLLEIGSLLSGTTSADDVKHSKPAGDIFSSALGKLFPISADDVLAVGDTPYDIIAASQCGIRTIALRSGGFPDSTLSEAGAFAIYGSVNQLFQEFSRSPLDVT